MNNCLFCKIVDGSAPADVLHRDEYVTVFRDIHPAAPTHVLIVPNRHIASINDLEESDAALMGRLLVAAKQVAAREEIAESGYRLIVNTGPHSGQVVFHLHLHLIGGRPLRGLG